MKTSNKLAILLSLAALVSFASAKTPESAYIETCLKGPGVPVPITVVSPSVGPGYAGSTVQLEFVVDATGLPIDLKVMSSPDYTVGEAVVAAVKQWRFTPAVRDGSPVATKVVLPVKIIDESLTGARYAMK
jgi:TonB family protein